MIDQLSEYFRLFWMWLNQGYEATAGWGSLIGTAEYLAAVLPDDWGISAVIVDPQWQVYAMLDSLMDFIVLADYIIPWPVFMLSVSVLLLGLLFEISMHVWVFLRQNFHRIREVD